MTNWPFFFWVAIIFAVIFGLASFVGIQREKDYQECVQDSVYKPYECRAMMYYGGRQ